MDQASRLVVCPDRCRTDTISLPRVELHFTVAPRKTLTWRAQHDAEIRVHDATLWITRLGSVDDYWIRSGDVLRVQRGERVWIGTDGDQPAQASITTAYVRHGERVRRTLAQVQRLLVKVGRRSG
ncbi:MULTISPECIES: DUF2917 domain-containing protein [Burkholderia]|uniref:DUF2917 domain-containing protein n=2 Tax=Burkholderia TaxID=32008 RepID=A0AAW3PVF4_9BURK|nr:MULTISPECIES: DUF2917 domain-containing protein [Burkholderia]MEB2507310.1 DUF2917 domain-containing protein [Burkholderia anthinoferrum]MEB2532545.1 DUF2917 domain-containing protein [Burkholderia anthinoferrum]MEB2559843.1 DUF2917 domain-containing protein [Burkholderia anthinoferrum]MEB2579966.1 DUF2917 domain-containing protein [Burkholderia anthinoferrum]KVH03927.1 hypothetical protein WS85_30250 [Burkholderia anthina]